jgi:ankyrin repeat protein
LHWAAKRNQYHIIPMLLRYGSKIDAEDYSGRTALHIASESNNLESVRILLFELATPFKENHEGKMPVDLTTNRIIKFYLERAKNVIFILIKNSSIL